MVAAPEPPKDESGPLDRLATTEAPADQLEPANAPRRFKLEYDAWLRDTTRVDVYQVRLRAFADDEYFQFFTAAVPGLDVIVGQNEPGVTEGSFRRAIADLAVAEIRARIESGEAPLDDRTVAIEVRPDGREAARRARREGGEEYAEGDVVAEFRSVTI